jgi:recombination endonuclease VII
MARPITVDIGPTLTCALSECNNPPRARTSKTGPSPSYCSEAHTVLASRRVSKARAYGVDVGVVIQAQTGVCQICGTDKPMAPGRGNTGDGGSFSIDHDHATGRFRGLLCSRCNRGIGFFNEDPARLRAAADYLDNTS